jgi:hypothetical protein
MTVRFPGRRRRRRSPVASAGIAVAVLTIIAAGLAAWLIRRRTQAGAGQGPTLVDAEFDQAALDRAAGEGMAPAAEPHDAREPDDARDPHDAHEPDDAREPTSALPTSNGVVRGLSGIL